MENGKSNGMKQMKILQSAQSASSLHLLQLHAALTVEWITQKGVMTKVLSSNC